MLRFILPVIIIAIAVTGFFLFTIPMYEEVAKLKTEVASYDVALDNSKALENERDKLTLQYNNIDPNDLERLKKLLPDTIDNIRLILEIEKIAAPYGMVLKDVKYNSNEKEPTDPSLPIQGGAVVSTGPNNYGIWNLEFSVTGSYNDFINFTRSLENNLRIVDIDSVSFSSEVNSKDGDRERYNYNFKIKTYWLKK